MVCMIYKISGLIYRKFVEYEINHERKKKIRIVDQNITSKESSLLCWYNNLLNWPDKSK
jgi:hypothetical protein